MTTTPPLPLDNPFWAQLNHAYGSAGDIPALLAELAHFPAEDSAQDEPWFYLWSALSHQGDVTAASFAAVPHIIAALAADPARASMSYFLLPASIELARHHHGITVLDSLADAYADALARLPALAGAAARPEWDNDTCTAALAAIAAATGNHLTAQLLLDTAPDVIPEVIEWVRSR